MKIVDINEPHVYGLIDGNNVYSVTEEEKKEQQILRQEYIANFRANLVNQLNNIDIQEADGTIVNLGEKFGKNNVEKN